MNMASSKDMKPTTAAFFPTIFIKNQFRSTPIWPPQGTTLAGKTALVTGANAGLGLEASDQLLVLGLSSLIMTVRSAPRGEAAAASLRTKYPSAKISVELLDMSSYDSIQAFAARMTHRDRIDIAILNAGILKQSFALVSSTGHEETIQVNYLSTVLLCILLLPVLKRKSAQSSPERITIVNSGLAFYGTLPTTKPILPSFDAAAKFDGQALYNTSKLLGMMFAFKLADSVSADDVVVNLVDPGFVKGTRLGVEGLGAVSRALFAGFKGMTARRLDVGASTMVNAAVIQGKQSHCSYIMSWNVHTFPGCVYTAQGLEAIETLWHETMTELSFANVRGILDSMKTTV